MLKPLVPKLRSDLSVRLGDFVKKQVPAKLKPIVVCGQERDSMEVRIEKADFFEAVISGGLLSKRETVCHVQLSRV